MTSKPRVGSVYWLLLIAILLTAAVYWPGLYGGWLFDDYPNIVDNPGVQPHEASIPALVRAALSSPASDFKRPLASLSFAANYLVDGLDPWGWKLTNLVLHLLNGVLVFLLAKALLHCCVRSPSHATERPTEKYVGRVALLSATSWMLLPINLTAVLYVVQREESLANLFVLLGLIGYVAGRRAMLAITSGEKGNSGSYRGGFTLCILSLILPTGIGVWAKETAIMLPLYAFLTESIVFQFKRPVDTSTRTDWKVVILFTITLLLPMILGIAWLLPKVLSADSWATRDFTLSTRLLSEARIVCDYLAWTLLPSPDELSFYHDQFHISHGLLSPWTTLPSMFGLIMLAILAFFLRLRQPLVALGISLYLGSHLLTGTVLPLELVYEHRNYFASFGVLLAIAPLLAAVPSVAQLEQHERQPALALPRRTFLICLLLWWSCLTALTAHAWGDSLHLAMELAARAPNSPRAQYELGRTYIIYSHYDPASPFTQLAYAPLERAASLPNSSILPQQALIFMNSRMRLPVNETWWASMVERLRSTKPTIQDESSLQALAQCLHDQACHFSKEHLNHAFQAALAHPDPSARLLAMYGNFAWNDLDNRTLGEQMTAAAVRAAPGESAYLTTWARMLIAERRFAEAQAAVQRLDALNVGGHLSGSIDELKNQLSEADR